MGKPFKDKLKNVGDFISRTIAEVTELTGRTSGIFIQGVQGHKRIEETVYRLESIFKRKRRLI